MKPKSKSCINGQNCEVCECDPCECELPTVSPSKQGSRSKVICEDDSCDACQCDPCECEIPDVGRKLGEPSQSMVNVEDQQFNLTEYIRAKEYFATPSTKSGLTVYDHLAEVLRKIYDERPHDPVDYLEEISYSIKRFKFCLEVDQISSIISPKALSDADVLLSAWQKNGLWSKSSSEDQDDEEEEDEANPSQFPNLMRVAYYFQEVNVGLPHEEMYRIALSIRQFIITHPGTTRTRFWGKIFGSQKNYYVLETELSSPTEEDLWIPNPDKELTAPEVDNNALVLGIEGVIDASKTMERAGNAGESVAELPKAVDEEFLGEGEYVGNNLADAELQKWEQYKNELMSGFPTVTPTPAIEIPPEEQGSGLNRRAFYVCNDLNDPWKLLPNTTPKDINGTRKTRWLLTGNLDAKIKTVPEFTGYEGNYLRALIARITSGSQVSPKGYFRLRKPGEYGGEDDEDEEDEEDEEEEGEDAEEKPITDLVYPARRFRPTSINDLLSPSLERWVHHTSHILRQGRADWWNPKKAKQLNDEEEEEEYEGEDEDEGAEAKEIERETGPKLFNSLAEDKILDETCPWRVRASSTVFTEFQVASVHSNLWPGASAYCTIKGKVDYIYVGDGNKFQGQSFAPDVPGEVPVEFKEGPEMIEIKDPSVQEEQDWIAKFKRQNPEPVKEPEEEIGEREEDEERE